MLTQEEWEELREDFMYADHQDRLHEHAMRTDPDYWQEYISKWNPELVVGLTSLKQLCDQYGYDFDEELKGIIDGI